MVCLRRFKVGLFSCSLIYLAVSNVSAHKPFTSLFEYFFSEEGKISMYSLAAFNFDPLPFITSGRNCISHLSCFTVG